MSKFDAAQWSAVILWTAALATLVVEVSLTEHPDHLRSLLLILTAAAVSATVVASARAQTNAVEAAFRLGLTLGGVQGTQSPQAIKAGGPEGKATPE